MKLVRLLHNPRAGDEEHSKNELLKLLKASGLDCRYSSTKNKGWEEVDPETEILIIAGGDGTVRRVAEELLKQKLLDKKVPIALLPLGTANNIAKTLGIEGETEEIIKTWSNKHIKKYDVGRMEGMPEVKFLLEGAGYGIFPRLIKEMKKVDERWINTPGKNLEKALQVLHDVILHLEPFYCEVETGGTKYSGNYLLAEVMNTCSIGPNLQLAPLADPGDGHLEIVLIPENEREQLAAYVLDELHGNGPVSFFKPVKAKNILLRCDEKLIHVDDELIKLEKPAEIKIEMQEGRLAFLVP